MEVHVGVAGARFRWNRERVPLLRGDQRVIEELVDAFEVGDDGAAERGDAVENEKIGIAAGSERVVEKDLHALGVVRAPGHLAGETIWSRRARGDDVRFGKAAVEDDVHTQLPRLCKEAAVESAVFCSASDEITERSFTADRAGLAAMVVKGRRIGRTKVKVSLDADPIEKVRHRLELGCGLDDLQVADESPPDVGFRFMDLHGPPAAGEGDGGGKARWPRACNESWFGHGDFGFWILDFGFKLAAGRNPKSKIQNPK